MSALTGKPRTRSAVCKFLTDRVTPRAASWGLYKLQEKEDTMPACIRVQVWDAAPGKQAEMMALMREAVPLWEKHGAKVRIFSNQVSGPNATTVSFISEYPSLAAYGTGTEGLLADPDVAKFGAKVNAAMVGRQVSGYLSTEVPSR